MDRANRYCSYCHGLNLDGGSQGEPSCFQCHGRRWVDRDPELVLAPADHTELRGGRYYHQVGLQTPVGTCDNCHGSDLTGNGTDDTPSCYLCHGRPGSKIKSWQKSAFMILKGLSGNDCGWDFARYRHQEKKIIRIFNDLFLDSEGTILLDQGSEPLYIPGCMQTGKPHRIYFAHGYWNSALHEISHWCIAGWERRQLEDYGYWYKPDGRSPEEQSLFETVEDRPQALEWIFTSALGKPFFLSVDNLQGGIQTPSLQFRQNVYKQAMTYLDTGLPRRGQMFLDRLLDEWQNRVHFTSYWEHNRAHQELPN